MKTPNLSTLPRFKKSARYAGTRSQRLLPKTLVSLAMAVSLASCGAKTEQGSDVLVTSVDHTTVKRQSIGNCWLYAQTTWLESLLLSQTGEHLDVSESYFTYWHWYSQIINSSASEVSTGGFWSESNRILLEHGWVLEKEFIPAEDGVEMSRRQDAALQAINEQLQEGGRLASRRDRTPEKVRAELDTAFGVVMADVQPLARTADATIVGKRVDGSEISLTSALRGGSQDRWQSASFPQVYGKNTRPTSRQVASRKALLQRVMKALNDRKPVVMTLMIDFNALDIADQTFKKSLLATSGPGRQGGHMVVLHDYAVKDVPGVGVIPEGDQPDEMKVKALGGQITMLKAKNSWGKNRPDRGLTDGYNRFDWDYLTSQLEWTREGAGSSYYTTLSNFVLPPGY